MPEPVEVKSAPSGIGPTFRIAVLLSLACALLVSAAAVLLEPRQLANEERYRQTIILDVAGLLGADTNIAEAFGAVEERLVSLDDGQYVDQGDDVEAMSVNIPADLDIAGIRERSSHATVYLVVEDGAVAQVILPVYGAGLWSTMYGYLAVSGDGRTVRALRFYEHAETPGLGDRIDDPEWLALWRGKEIYDAGGEPRLEVVRGRVAPGDAARHQVDGISGATLTGRGVADLLRYWTGPHGFYPYLQELREASDDE